MDTAVRQFAKSDFCLSRLGVAFGHSANTMNDKIEFMLTRKNPLATDEEGLGAEVLTQLPLSSRFIILTDYGGSI